MNVNDIATHLNIHTTNIEVVRGGDINEAFCLADGSKKYFLKTNDAGRFPGMFAKEASGLRLLSNNSTLKVPEVLNTGTLANTQYLLLSWMETGKMKKDFYDHFGKAIAQMHQATKPFFGLEENNYMGSLVQLNTPHDSWHKFYSVCRVLPLVKQLFDRKKISGAQMKAADSFCNKIKDLFPTEPSAFLHGDLWNGNYATADDGYATIYDPAVYFGHREMDIGLTKLFGGFDDQFYISYNEYFPLEKNWQERLPYTQLYPLLVHALLFDGHYLNAVLKILSRF